MNLKVSDTKREDGFTLIELLVVVIIIGILAAIAIPLFLNQRERAWQGSAESDARNAAIEIETLATRDGSYPAPAADLVEMFASEGVTVFYNVGAATLTADVADGGVDTTDTANFVLCAHHDNIETAGTPDERVIYASNLGGLQEWDDSDGCAAGDFTQILAD